MFFLIDFSYKQGLGIHIRLLPSVISVATGIRKFEVAAALKYFRNAEVWIPACAGLTAEFSAKIAPPVFRRLFASSVYVVSWALPTIMLGKRGRLKF